MTDSSFPFGEPAEPASWADDNDEGRGRKPLLLAGGLAAVVLAAGGYFVLGGSSGSGADLSAAPTASQATAPVVAPAHGEVVPPASDEQIGRNPFKARYIAPVEQPAPAEAPKVEAPPPPPVQPVQVVVTQPAPAPASESVPAEYPLTLKSVSDPQPEARTVTWEYDGKTQEVLPGQRFGKYGELVVLAYSTNEDGSEILGVIIQVGDASPFEVKMDETVNVK
jgi:hypothetical protein